MSDKNFVTNYKKKISIDKIYNKRVEDWKSENKHRDMWKETFETGYYKKVWESVLRNGFHSYPLYLWSYKDLSMDGDGGNYRTRPFYVRKDYNEDKSFGKDCYYALGNHRYMILKKMKEEGKIDEVETFVRDYNPNIATKQEFEDFLADPAGKGDCSNNIYLPYNLRLLDGSDDAKELLARSMLPSWFWYDKTILDVACSNGGWGFECLHNAAKYVTSFDKCGPTIDIANKLRSLFKYEDRSRFFTSSFSDVDWNTIPEHDVVFLNQCIYNIPEGKKVLDVINDKCKNFLIMYTYVTNEKPYIINDGFKPSWMPTVMDLKNEMVNLGFKYVYIVIDSGLTEDFMKNPVASKRRIKCFLIGAREKDIDSQFYFLPNEAYPKSSKKYDIVELAPDFKIIELRIPPECL